MFVKVTKLHISIYVLKLSKATKVVKEIEQKLPLSFV